MDDLTIGPGDPVRLPSHGPESIQVAFVTGPFERTYVKIKAIYFDPFWKKHLEAAVRKSSSLVIVCSSHQNIGQAGLAFWNKMF